MQNQPSDTEAQYKTLIVIWVALLMSQFLFVLLVFMTRPKLFQFDFTQPIAGPSGAMTLGFAVAAVTAVLLSFAFRKRLNERAAAEQNPAHVQTGLIIALALSEASTLFGVALAFAFEYQYFFLWMILGIIATIIHFPRRRSEPPALAGGQPESRAAAAGSLTSSIEKDRRKKKKQ